MAKNKTTYAVDKSLFDCIKTGRKNVGYTQVYIADDMGVSRSTYMRFENGKSKIFSPLFEKTMKKLGKVPYVILCNLDETPEQIDDLRDSVVTKDLTITQLQEQVQKYAEEVEALKEKNELLMKLNAMYEQQLKP